MEHFRSCQNKQVCDFDCISLFNEQWGTFWGLGGDTVNSIGFKRQLLNEKSICFDTTTIYPWIIPKIDHLKEHITKIIIRVFIKVRLEMLYYNNFNLSRSRGWWRILCSEDVDVVRWEERVIVILRRLILPARFMCGHRARAGSAASPRRRGHHVRRLYPSAYV